MGIFSIFVINTVRSGL
ncbi:TPA: erythromycin resistance leader peptide [Streptococcus pyogenes]|nr:erythromycin resistance leader peptide [Streptococcus pyogenes]HEQ4234228.1 erythromycin resistance leader peptide [Streptococcus pyogenes]HEQ4338290.1 erythromycin resistance leader peptide [Streptococcus pyogenes]HES7865493.1 erythromycin resistance leader peptide [Streptococcus pyogenes]HES8180300.1 erythromycin resistance leader peptide [Streptococcus pyogenes]